MSIRKELPFWALPAVIVLGLLVLGLVTWRAVTGNNEATGPVKKVYPGMYDIRQEIQKKRAESNASQGAGGR